MRATTARALNFGREDPLPMCLYLPNDTWIHFKSEVDRSIAVLAVPNPDFPVEGILGMNALECCQVKVDFKQRKLWLRVSPKALDVKPASTELGVGPTSQISNPIVTIPIKRRESGRFSLEASIGGKNVPLEIDTGANLIGLSPASIPALKLEKVGEGEVLVENGLKPLSKFIAPDTTVGEIRFLWPVVREGVDPKAELGGFGPSVSPHQVVIVDYPGLRLLTLRPTEEESVEQAMSQFISGTARIQKDMVLIDMPDVVGTARTVLKKIQNQTAATVLHDLRLLAKGNAQARLRLMALYKQVCARKGTITIEQAGTETTIEIGHSGN